MKVEALHLKSNVATQPEEDCVTWEFPPKKPILLKSSTIDETRPLLTTNGDEAAPLIVDISPTEESSTQQVEEGDRKGMILSLVILIGSIPALVGAWCWPALVIGLISGTVTSSARALGHKVAFITTLIMMLLLNGYMVRCAFTTRRQEVYRWIPLLLTLLAAVLIMAEPSRHLLMDFGFLSSQFFGEYQHGCPTESIRCLSVAGIIFTALSTYIGFFLLFWGTMWNAKLWPKLKSIPAKWRAIRRK